MQTKTKGLLIGFVLGFATTAIVGYGFWPSRDGAYFCCDANGNNCVLSPEGDCTLPIQWCSETAQEEDGTVYCAEW